MGGVETHAHLDYGKYDEDLDEVLTRARTCGVEWIGQVFLGPDAYEANEHLFRERENIFYLLGVHPNDVTEPAYGPDSEWLERMRQIILADLQGARRIKAIGEIGLDYYWDQQHKSEQRAGFAAQLELAKELDLPVAIHSRDAHDDAVEVLLQAGFEGRKVLWHCFGGTYDDAQEIVSHGWKLSIPGTVTYKKNDDLVRAVGQIGIEHVMLETDCPFLAPEPWRGKRCEPAHLVFTLGKVADVMGLEPEYVWQRTGATAKAFFGLD